MIPIIRSVLEYALDLSKQHVKKVTDIFTGEEYPIPVGFTEQDVNLDAPRLFTDKFYLMYILNMGKFGLSSYALALSLVGRDDIIDFYSDCLEESEILHNDAKKLAKEKGVYVRPPVLPKPEQVDFVKKQSFLTGYLGNRRPLLGVEIASLVYNAKRNALGQAITIGFSQVAEEKDVQKYLEGGGDISKQHLEAFNSILHEDYVSGAVSLAQEVTNSTIAPFSDKLMMYHVATLTASGIGQYGIAMSTSPRHDLGVTYTRLMAEVVHYSNEGAKIMINHGWMEQPPEATDRKKLFKKKKN